MDTRASHHIHDVNHPPRHAHRVPASQAGWGDVASPPSLLRLAQCSLALAAGMEYLSTSGPCLYQLRTSGEKALTAVQKAFIVEHKGYNLLVMMGRAHAQKNLPGAAGVTDGQLKQPGTTVSVLRMRYGDPLEPSGFWRIAFFMGFQPVHLAGDAGGPAGRYRSTWGGCGRSEVTYARKEGPTLGNREHN